MPRDLARLVKDARHGRMRVDLDLKRLDSCGHRLHSAMNRATIGIMTASLVVGSSIVMTVAEGPTLLGVPLLTFFGLLGYLIAFVNSLWIIFSIWRSIGNEGSDQACGRRVAFQVGLPWITISMKNDWKRIFCVRAVSLAEDARRA
jgi:hypothetical protein